MTQSRVSQIVNTRHLLFLANCIVEICSLDVQNSSPRVLDSICQLSRIFCGAGEQRRRFISVNIRNHDLQPLLFRTIQLINGVACLFSGPRYLPLRLKCIQWLNNLSTSNGIFVPVASYVLDLLEFNIVKEGGKLGNALTSLLSLSCQKVV